MNLPNLSFVSNKKTIKSTLSTADPRDAFNPIRRKRDDFNGEGIRAADKSRSSIGHLPPTSVLGGTPSTIDRRILQIAPRMMPTAIPSTSMTSVGQGGSRLVPDKFVEKLMKKHESQLRRDTIMKHVKNMQERDTRLLDTQYIKNRYRNDGKSFGKSCHKFVEYEWHHNQYFFVKALRYPETIIEKCKNERGDLYISTGILPELSLIYIICDDVVYLWGYKQNLNDSVEELLNFFKSVQLARRFQIGVEDV
jgi:hypothetical protein